MLIGTMESTPLGTAYQHVCHLLRAPSDLRSYERKLLSERTIRVHYLPTKIPAVFTPEWFKVSFLRMHCVPSLFLQDLQCQLLYSLKSHSPKCEDIYVSRESHQVHLKCDKAHRQIGPPVPVCTYFKPECDTVSDFSQCCESNLSCDCLNGPKTFFSF